MPINRPCDEVPPDPLYIDPMQIQFDTLQVPDMQLDNSARQGIGEFLPMLQRVGRNTGEVFNDQQLLAQRAANMDPRTSQNRSTG